MIFIDLANSLPTDPDIHSKDWTPWTQTQWENWLTQSRALVNMLAALDAAGKQEERNALIDTNSNHWVKLKPWLLALSHGKCWFSEVRELFSHYDVEHYRPKKVARGLDGIERDGYWWLAFDYMNFRICGNVGNRKKGGWFPLHAKSLCSSYAEQCEESESPYLLDPINIDDMRLISFDEEGRLIPDSRCTEWDKARVFETVERLKLNEHVALAEARRKLWQKLDHLLDEYEHTNTRCAQGNNPGARQKLRDICMRIREMTKPSAELSAVARRCVELRNNSHLAALLS